MPPTCRRTTHTLTALAVASVVTATSLSAAASAAAEMSPAERCVGLADTNVPETTISQARLVAATESIPEHCLVDGFVRTPGDEIVASNEVHFRVGLPTVWNHDFYFQGVGGLAGVIGDLGAGLSRGYASASTDTGHQAAPLDGRWALNNRPKQIDYGYRGVHVATVAAKTITGLYYGRDQRYSLFNGCSNGGRQGLMEAQRYPGDYDAVISQAPAFDAVDAIISWIWQMQAQLREPGAWLSPDDLAVVSGASLASNDMRDGLTDGLISEPERASIDSTITELSASGSLTPEKLDTLRAIYTGPTGPLGEPLNPGQPIGHEDGWTTWITGRAEPVTGPDGTLSFSPDSAPLGYVAAQQFLRYFYFGDPDYDLTDFDFGTDLPALDQLRWMLDATDPDLTEFEARGGKLLMTQGWADDALNATSPIDYHHAVSRLMGGTTTDEFFRLFMVPGMNHCGGGPGPNTFDALSAMERWVRDDIPPTSIVATHSTSGRTRPLCAYPNHAIHQGRGSIDDATNFFCTTSQGVSGSPAGR